jgi:hypothetical protein
MIYGLEAPDLGEGVTPLEAATVIKIMDNETGGITFYLRFTDGVLSPEAYGMLKLGAEQVMHEMISLFERPDDEE